MAPRRPAQFAHENVKTVLRGRKGRVANSFHGERERKEGCFSSKGQMESGTYTKTKTKRGRTHLNFDFKM